MKIVVDTNIVASAIFFGGKPMQILKEIFAKKKISAFVTPAILAEYHNTIEKLQFKYQAKWEDALLHIHRNFEIVEPMSQLKFSRDPDDDKFINCALDVNARFLVSGDKDLLVLKGITPIEILTASEFCERNNITS
jgi:putative PIN family toxin of toxin-antitoxin system